MSLLTLLLLPFSRVYDLVTRIRNYMYDTGWKPSVSFDLPVISVGNLAAGGTGKTPMTEYLVRLLSQSFSVSTLSRGYGRTTTGFRIVHDADTAKTVGDEPLQLYRKFYPDITVAVGEERALAIPYLLDEKPETAVVLLDDAFQHRQVKPGCSILLTEYNRPFYNDHLLPAGRLREHPRGAARADVVVVTKCPDALSGQEMSSIRSDITRYADKPVYFAGIRYADPVAAVAADQPVLKKVVLVSGIANHQVLEDYVATHFTLVRHFVYRDHHHYTFGDIEKIKAFVQGLPEPAMVLTTEKDYVKLREFNALTEGLSVFYLPIQLYFLHHGKEFDAQVLQFVKRD
ncbi:MAG: tetraacyldisaccharide 4'-kinase [Cyclobacteriaceae bacterium]|nr:tetraacyldisaccharide 4'-kinase [Cyclobacteriaceae bacterium]